MATKFFFKKNKQTGNFELRIVSKSSNDAFKILLKKFGKSNEQVNISTSDNVNKIKK
ncbi:hypothetical protein [Empedobacter tilapiae]